MAEASNQSQYTPMDKTGNVVLDIESLAQPLEKCCSGSPKMTKALSRKGSNRMEKRNTHEQGFDDSTKRLAVKVVPSQLEQFNQSLVPNKTPVVVQASTSISSIITDPLEGRSKRFNRLTAIHPRKILLIFATLSSMGTMILIYFTLAISRQSGT